MKRSFKYISQYLPWLLLLLGVDVFAALLLWITDTQAFYSILLVIVLGTLLLFLAVCYALVRLGYRKKQAFLSFLDTPDEYHEEMLLKTVSSAEAQQIRLLGRMLRKKQTAYANLQRQLADYEEYVESWAHESKTPLSLLTLLLDNRRDELPASVTFKLDYIRNRIQESVEQMLFYSRLKGTRKDYLFEHISICTCIDEVLEDYRPLLEEKQFQIQFCLSDHTVYSDRRGLRFLLGQVISNSIKYCSGEPKLRLEFLQEGNCNVLKVRDNGMGVRSCDLPYLFEKGFTGDSGNGRKKATGMGLYLVKEIAKDLNIPLNVDSEWGKYFEIQISFPIVKEKSERAF